MKKVLQIKNNENVKIIQNIPKAYAKIDLHSCYTARSGDHNDNKYQLSLTDPRDGIVL